MNITTTYLFTLVTNNDYNKLTEIIDSNKSRDRFFTIKARESLISKAVLVRSKQCFDLLLNVTPPEEYKNMEETCYVKGIYNSLEYYVAAPNLDNMYYLNKLLEKNVTINYYFLYKAISNIDLFIMLFNKYNKNNMDEINRLCYASIMNHKLEIFSLIYSYLENNNVDILNNNFKNAMYNQAISSNSISTIEFLISKGLDWKIVNEYPSLYSAFTSRNHDMFNYIYTKYEQLSGEELNSIDQIKLLPTKFNYNLKMITAFKKILKLKINWDDMTGTIAKLYSNICKDPTSTYHYNFTSLMKRIKEKYIIIEILFDYKLIRSNPLLLLNYNEQLAYYKKNITTLNEYPDHIILYKNMIKKFLEICKNYKYELATFIL